MKAASGTGPERQDRARDESADSLDYNRERTKRPDKCDKVIVLSMSRMTK